MPKTEPFEKYTDQYDDWFDRNRFVYHSEINAIKALVTPFHRALEVGVGTGKFAIPFGIQYGLEPSRKVALISQNKGVRVVTGVGEYLPFTSESFDLVLMVTTVCFLDDLERSFIEVHRVLEPGGSFFIGFVDRESPIGQMYEKHKAESIFYREATFFTVDGILSYLEKTGFDYSASAQTVFRPLNEVKEIELVKNGYGDGSFVVIKARKGKES